MFFPPHVELVACDWHGVRKVRHSITYFTCQAHISTYPRLISIAWARKNFPAIIIDLVDL